MKTDPRTKIYCLILYICSLFFSSSFTALAINFVSIALIYSINRLSIIEFLKLLRKTAILIVLSAALCLISNPWKQAAILAIRLVLAVAISSALNQTTTIKQLSDALEKMLHSRDFAMTITLALTFVPVLFDEAKRIKDAQTLRGAKFKGIKAVLPLVIPMFQNAFRRAGELGKAMEVRGYDIECKKTKMKNLKYSFNDALFFLCFACLLALVIYMRRFENVI